MNWRVDCRSWTLGWALAIVLAAGAHAADPDLVPPKPPQPPPGTPANQIPPKQPLPPPASPGQTRAPAPAAASAYRVETIAWGLEHPWAMAFLPDGRFLVAERPGRIRIVGRDGALSAPLKGLPLKPGERLLDLILDPRFAANRRLYFNYGEERTEGLGMTVVKARLSGDGRRLERARAIFRATPYRVVGKGLVSGRLAWGRDGALFLTVNSGGADLPGVPASQDLAVDPGKILRIDADGRAAPGNPFAGRSGARAEIYSYGHRDTQGVAVNPATGALWTAEHGPEGGDKLDIIRPGGNYGWPVISYGVGYDGNPVGDGVAAKPGMEQPVYFWRPDIAPSGMTFYTGRLFPGWRGDLFIAGLRSKSVVRLVLDGDRVVAEERLLEKEGSRIRSIYQGVDGALYVLTDDDAGRLLRVSPQKGR